MLLYNFFIKYRKGWTITYFTFMGPRWLNFNLWLPNRFHQWREKKEAGGGRKRRKMVEEICSPHERCLQTLLTSTNPQVFLIPSLFPQSQIRYYCTPQKYQCSQEEPLLQALQSQLWRLPSLTSSIPTLQGAPPSPSGPICSSSNSP